jgi:hypothetical protein
MTNIESPHNIVLKRMNYHHCRKMSHDISYYLTALLHMVKGINQV